MKRRITCSLVATALAAMMLQAAKSVSAETNTNKVLLLLAAAFGLLTLAFLGNAWGKLPVRTTIPLVDTNFLDTACAPFLRRPN